MTNDQTDHRADPVQAVAEVLEVHQIEFIDWTVGWDCGCNERAHLPGMPTLTDALHHQAEAAVAAARPAIEREAKAERDTLAARLAAVEALFAGGPDTPCRTLWRATEGLMGEWAEIECVEVPLDELRAAFATGTDQ